MEAREYFRSVGVDAVDRMHSGACARYQGDFPSAAGSMVLWSTSNCAAGLEAADPRITCGAFGIAIEGESKVPRKLICPTAEPMHLRSRCNAGRRFIFWAPEVRAGAIAALKAS